MILFWLSLSLSGHAVLMPLRLHEDAAKLDLWPHFARAAVKAGATISEAGRGLCLVAEGHLGLTIGLNGVGSGCAKQELK